MFDFSIMQIVAGLPGLVIAMVVHEYAHARVAVALGDFTPRLMGIPFPISTPWDYCAFSWCISAGRSLSSSIPGTSGVPAGMISWCPWPGREPIFSRPLQLW